MRGVALVIAVAAVWLSVLASSTPAHAAERCSSYPTPGTWAPANATVPRALAARYATLRRPDGRTDTIRLDDVAGSLTAAGIIRSGIRLLGHTASGSRVYLVPAQHLLTFRIAPMRCLPPDERPLERELLPQLHREYRHRALCLVIVPSSENPTCGRALGTAEALLYANGTPGFGLVPNGVHAVTVTYQLAPPRTVAVRGNFFAIVDRRQEDPPCGLQWLARSGSVIKIVTGCSYLSRERKPMNEYRAYVAGRLATLSSEVRTLIATIDSGNLAEARTAWLAAHLTWLDIGEDDGAYGCFGELGQRIDGSAAGLPGGTSNPDFTGFHKIELDLWGSENLTTAGSDADRLQSLVAELVRRPLMRELPDTKFGIDNWVLRPHEILEDADRDTLTGHDDYGSGTGLASLTADIAATRELLTLLAPVIDPLAPRLVHHARRQLDTLSAAIQATRSDGGPGGGWVALQDLPARQREQIDADTGAALETLAPIPDLITSTGKNGLPT